ncbi:MAG: hypothetical protein LUD77_04470, partial [Clostridiales bacterium]|nr:hypothetical protein [Clostridiales bacterium]
LFALLSGVRLCLAVSNFGINKYIMIFIRQTVKYLLGFLGVLLLYIFSGFAEKNIKKLSDIFKCVGDYSYDIYLMHNPYILALSCVVLNSFLGINAVITGIVSTLLGIAVPMGASKLIIRKFKHLSAIMLGR